MSRGQVPRHLIISVLAVSSEDALHYLDTKTGEIVSLNDPFDADDPNELMELAVCDDRYVALPGFEEVDAERIEVRFAEQQDDAVRENLLRCAQSLYSKMLFPEAVRNAGLRETWESFRDEALGVLAARWAASNELQLV